MELIAFIQAFNIIVIAIGTLFYMCCRSFSSSSPAADSDVADSAADSTAVKDDDDADNPPRREKYDVFISFRGGDTRLGITSHLHAALLQKKFETYIDNRLQRGEEIGPALLEAIEKSTISVIIFSQNYASSTWCLDELVHILKCNNREGRMVIPVFYDIDPSDVRKQHGSYADAFAQLEKRFANSIDKVHKWRDALTTAANLSGFDHSNKSGTEADLVKNVVHCICTKLIGESSCNLEGLFGIESRIKQIEKLLGIHSQDACITVGIWGMGGVGKTTLAETLFRKLSSKFDASCFLKNVRENSEKPDGLDHLVKTLFKEILKEEVSLPVESTFQERLRRTKVLIVLDDVSDSMQLERLAGSPLRFGTGSRIIITTRDRGKLGQTVQEDNIYKVDGLQPDDALQLFCSRAFKNNSTRRTDYKESAEKVVHYARGVPLALTVLGSLFFNCKSKEDWEDEFNKLKRFPNVDIQKVLRISYDRLGENEKEILLDIACFHKGKSVVKVKQMLDVRGFFATSGIRILIEMSLISIDSKWGKEIIEMHDLLQEMGRKIVQEQDIKDPGKRSRLFNDEDVYRVLRSNTETPNVEAIQVNWYNLQKRPLNCADFKKMSDLRLLIVHSRDSLVLPDVKFNTSLELPDSLRYLEWCYCPLESLPSTFSAENLVELHMPNGKVKKLWKEEQILVNLQVIDLWGCSNLTEVPNLSGSPKIVDINLGNCRSLVEIPSYFQHLDKLTRLDLKDCSSLKYLPEMPGNIQYLNLECSGIKELPESVWSNENISYLNLRQCKDLKKLPSSWCKLKNLEKLDLYSCYNVENLPEIWEPMEQLKSLSLRGTAVTELSSSICKLKYLESLDLTRCSRFSKFPEIFKPMEHLVYLSLEFTGVEMLPSSIGNLNRLQDLNLSRCMQLKDVPTSIYSLTNLKRLDFKFCRRLEKLPFSPVSFLSLEELELSYSGIYLIPVGIKKASRLSILGLEGCERLVSIPELPVLCNVKAEACASLKIVSSSRTALTQGWDKPHYCFRVFRNCPKLDNNSRSNIMDEAQITIMRMATVAPLEDYWLPCNPWPQINIACPGKEIPNWFSYQNEGSSVDIELCPDWFRTGLFGFALSVVVSPCQDYFIRLRANFIVKFRGESHELFNSQYIIPCNSYNYDCDGQQHVLVWNEAFRSEEVGKNCSPDVYKLAKEASVVFYPQDFASHMKVESCGICPLYAEDAEKFKFGHVFMSRGPKVEETRQDVDSKGGGS
ncbi:disease resistance protein RPV1-like isoform X1 [Malus domestica]|uniref:disease resistance protein RPV1-like isoform X1 n=1 Tax=Malus domestica TaxID=3750 RepID=UPI003975F6E2